MTWPTVSLGEVAKIERNTIEAAAIAEGTCYLGLENIERGGKILGWQVIGDVSVASSKFTFTDRHLLFGKLRPNLAKIARPNFSGVCSTDILPIAPGPRLDRDYLAHFLSQQRMVDLAASRAAGANLPRLSPGELGKFEIPLPQLDEQRRVAAILDRADALRAQRLQSLALLDGLTQAIFIDMFGDVTQTPRWAGTRLEACSSVIDCPHSTPIWMDAGEVCVRTSNLTKGGWNWNDKRYVSPEAFRMRSARSFVSEGDVILSREGTVGVAAVVEAGMKICMGQRLVQVRPDLEKVFPEYLLGLLLAVLDPSRIGRVMVGSTSKHLNVRELRGINVPLPPMGLQRQFADRMRLVKESQTRAATHLEGMDAAFEGLQARAFAGQLTD